jgi:hypothetical protein
MNGQRYERVASDAGLKMEWVGQGGKRVERQVGSQFNDLTANRERAVVLHSL